ncbi:hypothetical protein DFH09DRAFT_1102413 [Mycena vulgaris]|nr:hypothetical protein DFH09DRAFT_1102413 [Mycena vulgaris]
MPFLNFPVEVVLQVLRGMSLEDILNTTRVCGYLRNISLNFRDIWMDAWDAANIPLPLGQTLATMDSTVLPRHVYRASLIQRKWREPIITPIRSVEPLELYTLSSWVPWVPPSCRLGYYYGSCCNLLPGGQLFILGKRTDVGLYALDGKFGHEFEVEGFIISIDWMSMDNGATVTIGLLSAEDPGATSSRRLFVYNLTQNQDTQPVLSLPKNYSLPAWSEGLSMQRSAILVWGPRSLIIMDPQTGDILDLHSYLWDPSSKILHASLLPTLPLAAIVLAQTTGSHVRSLSMIEDIAELGTSVEHGPETPQFASKLLVNINVEDPNIIFRSKHPGRPQFALRTGGGTTAMVDIETRSITRLWTIQYPTMPSIPAIPKDYEYSWACPTPSGDLFVFIRRGERIEFFQYTPESTIQMKTLDPIATQFLLTFSNPDLIKIAFDPVRGTLLLVANPRVGYNLKYIDRTTKCFLEICVGILSARSNGSGSYGGQVPYSPRRALNPGRKKSVGIPGVRISISGFVSNGISGSASNGCVKLRMKRRLQAHEELYCLVKILTPAAENFEQSGPMGAPFERKNGPGANS